MKKIEQITVALAILGVVMKLLLLPGNAAFIGISLPILATIYFPLGFFYFNSIPIGKIFRKSSYNGISVPRGFGTFGAGLIFSILSTGILFKLLQLPGTGNMLTIGLTGGILLFFVILAKYYTNRDSSFYRSMFFRTLIIVGISGILFATPGLTLVKIFYRDNPEYVKAYEQSANNPDDRELWIKAEQTREKTND